MPPTPGYDEAGVDLVAEADDFLLRPALPVVGRRDASSESLFYPPRLAVQKLEGSGLFDSTCASLLSLAQEWFAQE